MESANEKYVLMKRKLRRKILITTLKLNQYQLNDNEANRLNKISRNFDIDNYLSSLQLISDGLRTLDESVRSRTRRDKLKIGYEELRRRIPSYITKSQNLSPTTTIRLAIYYISILNKVLSTYREQYFHISNINNNSKENEMFERQPKDNQKLLTSPMDSRPIGMRSKPDFGEKPLHLTEPYPSALSQNMQPNSYATGSDVIFGHFLEPDTYWPQLPESYPNSSNGLERS